MLLRSNGTGRFLFAYVRIGKGLLGVVCALCGNGCEFIGSSCLGLYCFDGKAREKTIPFDSAPCIYDAYRLNVP